MTLFLYGNSSEALAHLLLSNQKKVHRLFFNASNAGQHASQYGGTGIPEPVNGLRHHCFVQMMSTE